VAWQSDKLESANVQKFRNRIFLCFLVHPEGKQPVQDYANLLWASLFCQFILPLIGDALFEVFCCPSTASKHKAVSVE